MCVHDTTVYTPEEIFARLNDLEGSVIITGIYNEADAAATSIVKAFFSAEGPDLSRAFHLYFHWFNLVHELSHILASANGLSNQGPLEKVETMVNRIAAAFWREHGDKANYRELCALVDNAFAHLPNPIPQGETFTSFYERYDIAQDETMMLYAFFQFTLSGRALHAAESLEEVLKDYGLNTASTAPQCTDIIEETAAPQKIVDAARAVFLSLGLAVPPVTVIYCNNPGMHCVPK